MVDQVRQIRKAIAGAAAVTVANAVSRYIELDVVLLQEVLDALFVGFLVWLVPNAAKYVDPSHDSQVTDA